MNIIPQDVVYFLFMLFERSYTFDASLYGVKLRTVIMYFTNDMLYIIVFHETQNQN